MYFHVNPHKNHELPLCLNCPKFGQLIIRKIIRIIATRYPIFEGKKCTKFDFGPQTPFEELTVLPLTAGCI